MFACGNVGDNLFNSIIFYRITDLVLCRMIEHGAVR